MEIVYKELFRVNRPIYGPGPGGFFIKRFKKSGYSEAELFDLIWTKILPESIQILLAQELFNVLSAQPAKTPSFTPVGQKAIFSPFPRKYFWQIQFAMSIWTTISHQKK